MSLLLAISLGLNVALALVLVLACDALRFEHEWRQEEERAHEHWFRRAIEAGSRDRIEE